MDQGWDRWSSGKVSTQVSTQVSWAERRQEQSKCIEMPLVFQFLVLVSMRPGYSPFPVLGFPKISVVLQ